MKVLFILVVGILLTSPAVGSEAASERAWTYAELVHALDGNNIDHVEGLATRFTKCGFGPGEEGKGCVRRVLETDQSCKKEVLRALKQGCAMAGNGKCIAPPQAVDGDILYVGPRIHLAFSEDGSSMAIMSMVCGGD